MVEVRIRVPAGAHLLDRQIEDLGREARPKRLRHARARGRRRARPPRPPAAPATAPPSRTGAAARGRASTAPVQAGCRDDGTSSRRSRSTPRSRRAAPPRGRAHACLGREAGEDVADGRRRDERADQMAAAALVLLRRARAVLVRADRDVLGAVVRGELRAPHREHRRCKGKQPRHELLRSGPQARLANGAHGDRRGRHRDEHAPALHRHLRPRQRPLHLRQQRERLGEPRRPAEQRARDARRAKALQCRRDLDLAVGVADRARPGARAVHEHAVRESHAAEADLLVAHRSRGYPAADRSARCSDSAAGPGLPSPICAASIATTGITSRIEEVRNASSAASSRSSGNEPSSTP